VAVVINILLVAYTSPVWRNNLWDSNGVQDCTAPYAVNGTSFANGCDASSRACFAEIGGVDWLPADTYLPPDAVTTMSYMDEGLCNDDSVLYEEKHCDLSRPIDIPGGRAPAHAAQLLRAAASGIGGTTTFACNMHRCHERVKTLQLNLAWFVFVRRLQIEPTKHARSPAPVHRSAARAQVAFIILVLGKLSVERAIPDTPRWVADATARRRLGASFISGFVG
jgi:hypothetical protein